MVHSEGQDPACHSRAAALALCACHCRVPSASRCLPTWHEGQQVPLRGPCGRLIRYSYHTAHSGSDQIKTGDFLFTDFFISASCRQDAMQHAHLSQFAPSHLPSLIFQQSLEVKALSLWLFCTWKVIMASPCRGPGGAICCRGSSFVDWK